MCAGCHPDVQIEGAQPRASPERRNVKASLPNTYYLQEDSGGEMVVGGLVFRGGEGRTARGDRPAAEKARQASRRIRTTSSMPTTRRRSVLNVATMRAYLVAIHSNLLFRLLEVSK